MWKFVCQTLTCEQALLFQYLGEWSESRENAREKCFYRYGSTLLERVSTHELGKFLYNFRGKKPVTDLRVFVLKVQARSPVSFTVWLSFHFSPKPKIPFLVVRFFFAPKPHGNASARVTLATSAGRVCSRARSIWICNRNCQDLCKRGRVALRKENDHKRSSSRSGEIRKSATWTTGSPSSIWEYVRLKPVWTGSLS